MKKLFTLIILLFLLATHTYAQEGDNWFTATKYGINFKCAPPTVSAWINPNAYLGAGAATSISDTNGNLLFFTDGRSVYNSLGNIMPNGHNVLENKDSDVGFIESVLAMPDPRNINRYYVFFTTEQSGIGGYLGYVIVDMTEGKGYGDVVADYQHIENNTDDVFASARCRNKRDFWLLLGSGKNDSLITYLITPSGLKRHAQWELGSISVAAYSYPVFSNDGRRFAMYQFEGPAAPVNLLDFNDSTGYVSNRIRITNVPSGIFGLTFSPDNTKLYINAEVSTGTFPPYQDFIYQYDVSPGKNEDAINASKTVIYKLPPNSGDDLQAAPDGKIYGVDYRDQMLWAIDDPNEKGTLCHFNPDAVVLDAVVQVLPNYVTRKPDIMPYTVSGFCNNSPVVFTPFQNLYSPTFYWDFGDTASGSADTSTQRTGVHLYQTPGTYRVHFMSWNYDSIPDTFTRFVCISKGLNTAKLDTALCGGETATLDAGNPGAKYLWNTGDNTETIKGVSGIYWAEVSNGSCMITDTFHIAGLSTYKINLGRDTTLNKGDSLELQTGYPTTIWSNGSVGESIKVTQAGTYWALLKGDKCQASDTIYVLAPVNVDTGLCQGETITLDGGNPGTHYLWNDGSTSQTKTVSSGIFWVKVSLGSFAITDSFHVVALGSAKINLGKDTAIISRTTLILHSGYDRALWSTGNIGDTIHVTKAGIYWASLTGDKCAVSDTIRVTTYVPKLVMTDMDANVCSGETATIDAGNPGATYLWWYNGDTARRQTVGAGVYWVVITNASGTITDTAHVIDINKANINLGNDTTIASGATLVLHSGYPTTLWSTGAKGDTIHVTQGGTYWAALVGDKCSASDTIVVKILGDIKPDGEDAGLNFTLAPNPARGFINLEFTSQLPHGYDITVYDLNGKLLLYQKYYAKGGDNHKAIDISTLAVGSYILKLTDDSVSASAKFEVR